MTTATFQYRLPLDIEAGSGAAALMTAGQMLRTGVSVVRVVSYKATSPGWYHVDLIVEEASDPPMPLFLHEDPDFAPESADPITAAKWEAARHGR